jgi:hypothetical protein
MCSEEGVFRALNFLIQGWARARWHSTCINVEANDSAAYIPRNMQCVSTRAAPSFQDHGIAENPSTRGVSADSSWVTQLVWPKSAPCVSTRTCSYICPVRIAVRSIVQIDQVGHELPFYCRMG